MEDQGATRFDLGVVAVDRRAVPSGRSARIDEQEADIVEQRWVIALECQHIVAAAVEDGLAVIFWQSPASAVTIRPSSATTANSRGTASISFDAASALCWPCDASALRSGVICPAGTQPREHWRTAIYLR